MARIERKDILAKLRRQVREGIPIIGSGAGVGLTAKCAQAGGVDLIIIYNSGRFRMAGQGSACGRFPYSDANGLVMEMADEILPAARETPVIAGVLAGDPFREMERLLPALKERGFSGIQNFPTVGNNPPQELCALEESGYGYSREIELVRLARSLDMLTTPYCFSEQQAVAMAQAGADIIVAHMGLTTSGLLGAAVANGLDVCVEKCEAWAKAALSANPEVLVICHGGAIDTPAAAQYIFDHTEHIVGFYGASSAERLPTERALIETMQRFKALPIQGRGR